MHTHPIACEHSNLTGPAALAEIGAVLATQDALRGAGTERNHGQ